MKKKQYIALIPARVESVRFPRKLLQKIGEKSVILTTFESVLKTQLFSDVFVVTDSMEIANEIEKDYPDGVIFDTSSYPCGTDRIAAAAKRTSADVIFNVQGDEPFVETDILKKLIDIFEEDEKKEIQMASLMHEIKEEKMLTDPNVVKVVVDKDCFALYFSRLPIPMQFGTKTQVYKHIGVYAFQRDALLRFSQMPEASLEKVEKIECLRWLENGEKIKMSPVKYEGVKIDTKEDLKKVYLYMNRKKK